MFKLLELPKQQLKLIPHFIIVEVLSYLVQ